MEEILSKIFNGINLVEELKFNLSAQESPESLSSSLGSISTLFRDANERLGILLERKNAFVPNQPEPKPVQVSGLDQMMMQIEPGLKQDHRVRERVIRLRLGPDDSGPGCAFSTPRPRRRKKDGAVETVLVATARMVNMGTPPDDNYVWRKYGQKEILGSRYPRSYYRCNHQKVYKCPAKKQVQRLDEDPYMLRVTYRSSHTCQFSTTSSFSSTATTPVNYGPNVHNMADLMFENTDSVVPFCEPYLNNDSLVPGAASYEDSWKSTWQSYDMS
ncbi:PREDICTED: WRKY transcription factor 55 isoform X1 [Brassica oleracea var. oleracea]|uniref:WRKY transcription factor 55 isoform X1 n=1 Tax=Brassica oleracea var. oleracea TaxID=109376 RepID=UPI0006A6DADA|nr:PREDICTED: WRKY transcription factor 55 isoform X1 [Brassica oleracea var. oleracea]